jgi:hypothetical protein
VINLWDADDLVFYAFDPLHGKGPRLGDIRVTDPGATMWAISPDGSRIAVVTPGRKNEIGVFTIATRAWSTIAVEPGWGEFQSVCWTADGQAFFFLQPDPCDTRGKSPEAGQQRTQAVDDAADGLTGRQAPDAPGANLGWERLDAGDTPW